MCCIKYYVILYFISSFSRTLFLSTGYCSEIIKTFSVAGSNNPTDVDWLIWSLHSRSVTAKSV